MNEPAARIRVDKWLWHARLTKTRSLAQALIRTGKLRVNSDKIATPSRAVGPGDVLTLVKDRQVLVVRIEGVGQRRGPAPEAQALYADLTPPPPPKVEAPRTPADQGRRDEGAGRPTKRERRQLERFREHGERDG